MSSWDPTLKNIPARRLQTSSGSATPHTPAADAEYRLPKAANWTHDLTILAMAVGVIILALSLQIRPDQRVEFRWWPNLPLPHTCLARACLNLECPGCGLTRSFIHLARGDCHSAFQIHRLGWLIALVVLVQLPYRLLRLKSHCNVGKRVSRYVGFLVVGLMISNWLLSFIV